MAEGTGERDVDRVIRDHTREAFRGWIEEDPY